MRKNGVMRRAVTGLLSATVILLVGGTAAAAKHPRLVSVKSTRCTTCHNTLVKGVTVHPPAAEECTNCHEVTVTSEGTSIALAEEEPALCVDCHDDKAAAAEGKLAFPHAPVTDSCLNCHNPHSSPNTMLLDASPRELCAGCHETEELQKTHGGQLTKSVSCLSCHLPHGGPNRHLLRAAKEHPPFAEGSCDACHRPPFAGRVRLRARGSRLCTACHGEVVEKGAASVHPALDRRYNRKVCIACHDPHMSDVSPLLRAGGPDLCLGCHRDVVRAARADTGHAAAAEDCTNCHQPHSAPNHRLHAENPPKL